MQEERSITLNQDDDCFVRARKLVEITGLRDGGSISSKMAEGVELYRKLDVMATEERRDKRRGEAHEFIAMIARMKIEGECYDSDGNLVDPGTEGAVEYEPEGTDDEIDALYDLIARARELVS